MATGGGFVWTESFKAAVSMADYQYHVVRAGSAGDEAELGSGGSGPVPIGVIQNDPLATYECEVMVMGRTKVWASVGTAITIGDFVSCGSIGHVELAAGSVAQGIALEALASGSAVIEVLWLGPGHMGIAIDNTP